jgi:DUF971 family protein
MTGELNPMIETQAEPEHIAISKSKGIQIDWKDGHRSQYSLSYLRDECPCATCTGAHGTEPQKANYSAPAANPFQLYTPTLKMLNVEAVGHYARCRAVTVRERFLEFSLRFSCAG